MLDLKYSTYDIVFQEVPNETTLVFNITGCPHHCEGCHSKYMWEYTGNYLENDYLNIISEYKSFITCVCFMGGDQNIEELNRCSINIKKLFPNMKICIYSGLSNIDPFKDMIVNNLIDYIKIGPYIQSLGGLDHKTTNQKMYKKTKVIKDIDSPCNSYYTHLDDITYKFQNKKI